MTEIKNTGYQFTCNDLLSAAQDAIIVIDAMNGTIVNANERAHELTGWSPGKLEGEHFTALSPPEYTMQVVVKFETIVQAGKSGSYFDLYFQHKKGTIIPVEMNPGIIPDEHGKPAFILGIIRDISEKKEHEKLLKESEERYKSIFNHIKSAMLILEELEDGQDFIIKSLNLTCEKVEHIKNDEVTGKRLSEVFSGIFQSRIYNNLARVSKSGKPEFIPDIFHKDERNESWRDYYIYLLPSGELAVCYDDVSERKYAERAMQQAYNIVNHIRSGLYVFKATNTEDDRSLVLIYANPVSEKIMNIPLKDSMGRYIDEIFPRMRETGLPKMLLDVILTKETIQVSDLHYYDERVKYGIFSIMIFPLPENQVGVSFDDVTDKKIVEDSLKEHSEIIKNLYEGVSHEVGEKFFELLVLSIAKTLKADYTFVGELQEGTIRTRILSAHGKIAENFEYAIKGTPCEKVLNENICYFSKNAWKLFPEDKLLTDLGIEGYIGVPLKDVNNVQSGILVALFEKPVKDVNFAEAVLRIFSNRVGNELERQRDENKIHEINHELSENKAYLDSIFRAAPIGIGVVVKRVFSYVNERIIQMTGYSAEELMGKSARMLYPSEEEFLYVGNEKYRQIDLMGIGSVETKWLCKDGSIINILLSSCPIDPSNHDTGVTFTALDITKRKEAEDSLKHERDYINRLNETIPLGILAINAKGNIVFANQQAIFLLGLSKDEISSKKFDSPGWKISDFGGNPFPDEELPFTRVLKDKTSVYNIRHAIERPNNKKVFLSINASPVFDKNGEIEEVVASIEDVTRQIVYEKQILEQEKNLRQQNEVFLTINEELKTAKEKAEESDRLKSSFLANMSHEIRTPMNGILGFAGLLARPNLEDDKKVEYIGIIRSSCDSLLHIVNDILDISKIEAGIIEINEAKFSLNEMIDNELLIFEDKNITIREKPLKIICYKGLPDDEATFVSDEKRISQILNNLLDNAFKFTREGTIEFGYRIENDKIVFYVRDTGIGIPSDKFDLIFERFTQADQTLSREFGGTGLGLAICKSYAELLNGKIWLESVENAGSTFYFALPYIKPIMLNEMNTNIMNDKQKWTNKRILLIEDDPVSRELLVELFCETGLMVSTASSAREAVEKTNLQKFDLILLDIRLPDMNGYELAGKIREKDKLVPIIAQTAYAMEDDKNKCIKAGCNGYISKPIQGNLLFEIIERYMIS